MAARSTPEAARGLPKLTDPTRVATSNTRASTNHADVVATNGATGLSGIATTLRDAPRRPRPTHEHVTQPASTSARGTCSRVE